MPAGICGAQLVLSQGPRSPKAGRSDGARAPAVRERLDLGMGTAVEEVDAQAGRSDGTRVVDVRVHLDLGTRTARKAGTSSPLASDPLSALTLAGMAALHLSC